MNPFRNFIILLSITLFSLAPTLIVAHGNENIPMASHPEIPKVVRMFENKGQWDERVIYKSEISSGSLYFEKNRLTYDFCDFRNLHENYFESPANRDEVSHVLDCHSFSVTFPGSKPNPEIEPFNIYPDYRNYFIGNDPSKWAPNVSIYEGVIYKNIYPGTDLRFTGQGLGIKYQFELNAGADASIVKLAYSGVDDILIENEELHIVTSVNRVVEQAPYAYQHIGNKQVQVQCKFHLNGTTVSFTFPDGYDKNYPLVIDPTLVFSTYTGSTADNFGYTATYDTLGNLYAGGIAFGVGYPFVLGSYQTTYGGGTAGLPFGAGFDISITKFNAGGTGLVYSTYLGGNSNEQPHSLITTPAGELLVYGRTTSPDFPTSGSAYSSALSGAADIIVTKFNAAGTGILGSTYIGGTGNDGMNIWTTFARSSLYHNYGDDARGEIMIDGSDNVYIASCTQSANFPVTPGAFQTLFGGGTQDGVVFKMNPNLSVLTWSTFLGGTGNDAAYSVKVPASGRPFVAGGTESANFPTTPTSYQPGYGGAIDGFVLQFNPAGSGLLNSSYIGTTAYDQAYFLELDKNNDVFLLGQTMGAFPVSPGVYSNVGGKQFVMKLDSALSIVDFSTVFGKGGATIDISPTAFLVDICGFIYIAGWGGAVNYSGNTTGLEVTADAIQPTTDGSDLYLMVLAPGALTLSYASFYGGAISPEHVDGGTSRFNKDLQVYHAVCAGCGGNSDLPIFPTPGAYSATNNSTNCNLGAFKMQFEAQSISSAFASFAIDSCAPYPVVFTNNSIGGAYFFWDFGDGNTSTDTSKTINYYYPDPGTYHIKLIVIDSNSCNIIDSVEHDITVYPNPIATTTGDVVACAGGTVTLGAGGGVSYEWTPAAGMIPSATVPNPTVNVTSSTTYMVIITDIHDCVDTGYVDVSVFEFMADAGPPTSFCQGSGGSQLHAGLISGGSPPYYYEWWCDSTFTYCGLDSVYDDDPIANPNVTTTYYLQVTDANGCVSEIDSVVVTVLPNPIADAGADVYICAQPAPGASLNGSVCCAPGPYDITWVPGAGLNDSTILNPYARPDTTTTYTMYVVSSNGCTSVPTTVDTLSTVTVHVKLQPIADAGPDRDFCDGDTMMLMGIGYGAGPAYSYEWSPYSPPVTSLSANNIPNPLAFPNFTTDYILTVWSNGCPSIGDTVTANVHTQPTVDAGPDRDICGFESALLDGQLDGDSTSTFELWNWWDASTLNDPTLEDPTATPDTSGWYYVIGTTSWGCDSPMDSVFVKVKPTPYAEAGPPIQICLGDTVNIPGSYSYHGTPAAPVSEVYASWIPNTNISDSTAFTPDVWPSNTVYYFFSVTHNNCTTTDSVLVTVIPFPAITLDADTAVICEGQSAQLTASGGLGGASFSWSPATGLSDPTAPNPIASPGSTTTYTIILEEGGCFSNDSLTITVIPTPEMAYMSSNPKGCAPLEVSFLENAKDAIAFVWDFGDGTPTSNTKNPTHTYDLPGTYIVTLTGVNSGGCEASINTIIVTVSDPGVAEFTSDPGFPIELALPNSGVQFIDQSLNASHHVWNFGDGTSGIGMNPYHTYTTAGEFNVTLTVTTSDGCVSQVVHGPFVIRTPELFIPNVFSPNDDGINDEYLVSYTGTQPFTLEIYDRWGVKLFGSKNKNEGWDGNDVNGVNSPEGVYYYRVTTGDIPYTGAVSLLR